MGILTGVAGFLIPVALAEFTKQQLTEEAVVRLIVIVVALYIFSIITAYFVRGRGETFAFTFPQHLRIKYFRRLANMPVSSLQRVHSGFSMSQINKVCDGYTDVIFSLMWNVLPGLAVATVFLYFVARESMVLAVFNITIIVAFMVISFFLSRKMVPLIRESSTRKSRMLESYVDFMANITTVKKLGLQRYAESKLTHRSRLANEQIARVQTFHARRWFFQHALFGLAYLSTVGFLIYQIGQGTASPALLILFIAAYGTLRGLIEQLSETIKSLMEMRTYVEQLEEILDSETVDSARRAGRNWKVISMHDVTFRYEDGQPITVPEFVLKKGSTAVITGKSGQGKSTFVNLFMNGLSPQAGKRFVDDKEYEEVGPAFFGKSIALVAQDTELFNMSVRENLLLGREMTDKTLIKYLDEIDMTRWLEGLEHGLDTVVGEKGIKLSAGQKQRLSILRAVLLDRDITILDEPTSHLDVHTEETVVNFMKKYLGSKTNLIITHRPALLELADVLYEVRDHEVSRIPSVQD